MIPQASDALMMLSQRIMSTLLPELKSTYSLSDGALTSLLMNVLSAELGEGIKRRMLDIAEMKDIFSLATPDYPELDLDTLITEHPVDLGLLEVNVLHDACTRGLIQLHERVEAKTGAAAKELEILIWQYLADHNFRHQIQGVG